MTVSMMAAAHPSRRLFRCRLACVALQVSHHGPARLLAALRPNGSTWRTPLADAQLHGAPVAVERADGGPRPQTPGCLASHSATNQTVCMAAQQGLS
jgi:hypothetical protein